MLMRPIDLEAIALRLVDAVRSGQPSEDATIELKAEWPSDANRTARQLAGHCNAVPGGIVKWIIGLDEERGPVGVVANEWSDWWRGIQAEFDELSPDLVRMITVPLGEQTLVACAFSAERAPFVVKNSAYGSVNGGRVSLEIPWREANATRSARRSDLIRILADQIQLPGVEVRDAYLCSRSEEPRSDDQHEYYFRLRLDLYVTPRSREQIVIPFHNCEVTLQSNADSSLILCATPTLHPRRRKYSLYNTPVAPTDDNLSRTIDSTQTELIISGPGLVQLTANSQLLSDHSCAPHEITFAVAMTPANAGCSVSMAERLIRTSDELTDPKDCAIWRAIS